MKEFLSLPRLFKFVVDNVMSHGGDGYGYIVSKDYKYLAQKFEEHEDYFVQKDEYEDIITFSSTYSQDAIFFASPDADIVFPDIVIRLD